MACSGNQISENGRCYTPCPPGYTGMGESCLQDCPPGFTDAGTTCLKTSLSRGAETPVNQLMAVSLPGSEKMPWWLWLIIGIVIILIIAGIVAIIFIQRNARAHSKKIAQMVERTSPVPQ